MVHTYATCSERRNHTRWRCGAVQRAGHLATVRDCVISEHLFVQQKLFL